jgi:tetratricopeptide (TPR) repeat protein
MFGWFAPKISVDASTKRWVEARMGWLLGQFDETRTLQTPMILPNEEFYPDPYDGTEEAGRTIFERTCRYMGIASDSLVLKFSKPEPTGQYQNTPPRPSGWAGLYDSDEESRKTIWLDLGMLDDPMGLVATIAHELSHFLLLGENRLDRHTPDMEAITDLATVVLGMGVFNANVSFRTKCYTAVRWHFSSTSRMGYLRPDTWSYALALFGWLREEAKSNWISYLEIAIRDTCKCGLAYLKKTNDAEITIGEPLDAISLEELFPHENDGSSVAAKDSRRIEEETQMLEESETELDRRFSEGYTYADSGDWQAAADAFSDVIRCNNNDDEAYQSRAWAYLELGRFEEAVQDAEKAVSLQPDEISGYLIRGVAYSQAKRYEKAIVDLSYYLDEEDYMCSDGTPTSKALYFRGLAYSGLGDFSNAIKDFNKATIRYPHWPQPYYARADVHERLGNLEKAKEDRAEAAYRKENFELKNR